MSESKIKIYKASAGSGKTYTLALEYIKELLFSPVPDNYKHILAVTFTKDATGEMKDRILAELYGLAFNTPDSCGFLDSLQKLLREDGKIFPEKDIRERAKRALHRILHDFSRLNITTIDSFFQRILRNLARELGKGSRFNLEMNTSKVLSEAVKATIEKAGENQQVLNWLTTYIENKLDEGKNWQIEEEIFDFSRCIYDEFFQEQEHDLRKQLKENPQVFAELNKRQYIIQQECKTFFKQSFEAVNRILDDNRLETSDFGNSKYALAVFGKLARGDYKPTLGANVEKCRKEAENWGAAKSKRKSEVIALAASDFMSLLEKVLEKLKVMNTSQMIARNLHQLGLIRNISEELSEQNAENNRFMLSDTALFLNRMIDESDAPFIYEKLGEEIRHVMIDEFQDTSRLQWDNFRVFLSNIMANNLFSLIVGDVKQSIYRWRNGDWRILNSIGQELNIKESSLNTNYRSEKEIIDFNNHFFPCAARSLNELYETQWGTDSASPFLSSYHPDEVVQQTNKSETQGRVSIDFIPKKTDEEETYEDRMKKAVPEKLLQLSEAGIPAHEICILTRYNKDVVLLADYLSSIKADYPLLAANHYFDLISNEAFRLDSSQAVKIIVEALRCIADPDNPIAKVQLESLSGKNISSVGLRSLPLLELITCLYNLYDLEQLPGQTAYLFAFYDAVSAYLNENFSDIPHFLAHWDEELYKKTIASGTGAEGIRAMSIHKSKGLQFHTVIIPFCDWEINPRPGTIVWCGPKQGFYDLALLPVSYNKSMADTIFSEEYKDETAQSRMDNLNILYVAFTRAERNLLILACDNEKLDAPAKIATVSDLLQLNVNELNGNWNEEKRSFEKGNLDSRLSRSDTTTANRMKQTPLPFPISFVSKLFDKGESIFKQSNQSREFVNPEAVPKGKYVAYGNIMHKLFEQINVLADIDPAIENHIAEGLIHPDEKQYFRDKIKSAIAESRAEDWFSGRRENYSESTILLAEEGELKQKRPDRVLLSDDSTMVIDFKFGEAHNAHKKQVKEYMNLLENMNYPSVEGYLWYVEERKIEKIA